MSAAASRGDGAGLEEGVGQRVLRDVRQRLDHLGADRARDARPIGLQQRRFGATPRRSRRPADRELDRHAHRLGRRRRQCRSRLNGANPASVTVTCRCRPAGSGAVNRPASFVTSSLRSVRVLVGDDDGRAGNDGFLRVGDGAGDGRRPDLRGGARTRRRRSPGSVSNRAVPSPQLTSPSSPGTRSRGAIRRRDPPLRIVK